MDIVKTAGTLRAATELGERAIGKLEDASADAVQTWYGRTLTPAPSVEQQTVLIESAVEDAHLAVRLVNVHRPMGFPIGTSSFDMFANRYLDDLADGRSSASNAGLTFERGTELLGEIRATERGLVRDARVDQAQGFARALIDELTERIGVSPVDEAIPIESADALVRAAIG